MNERTLYNGLDELIRIIEEIPQINIRGIISYIEELVITPYKNAILEPNEKSIYSSIAAYCKIAKEAAKNHQENRFDNQVGALSSLKRIRSEYFNSNL